VGAKVKYSPVKKIFLLILTIAVIGGVGISAYYWGGRLQKTISNQTEEIVTLKNKIDELTNLLNQANQEIERLKNEDLRTANKKLEENIKSIEKSYKEATSIYESIIDLPAGKNTIALSDKLATILSTLSKLDYLEADKLIATLKKDVDTEKARLAALSVNPPAAKSNTPPGAGFSRQTVTTDIGEFTVSMVAADLSQNKVIIDTASDGDCGNNCPTLPLATYVSRNGAYAGINGTYFCPASYPSCSGKTNSFDLLVMNKNKTYFNSGNNVYSTNPAFIFSSGSVRVVRNVSEWGRDTGVDGVISNFPLLVFNRSVVFGGDDDPKKGGKGSRGFVANRGNTVYIGIVYSATVAEGARALAALGMDNAMNLDSGGSTALWSGGYKAGPGREIPNAILFVRK
jgi:Phosphodiester glycosidase